MSLPQAQKKYASELINTGYRVKIELKEGVEQVSGADRAATADDYSLQGILLKQDATEADVRQLPAGIYIYKGRKIAIR